MDRNKNQRELERIRYTEKLEAFARKISELDDSRIVDENLKLVNSNVYCLLDDLALEAEELLK